MGVTVDETPAAQDPAPELRVGDMFTSLSGTVYLVVYDPASYQNRVVDLSNLSVLHKSAEAITETAAFHRRFMKGTKVTLEQEHPFE